MERDTYFLRDAAEIQAPNASFGDVVSREHPVLNCVHQRPRPSRAVEALIVA